MSENAVEHDALVAEVLGPRKVVLNKGRLDGISTGNKFIVLGLGGEIHDPKTGESLGILEEIKGKGEVTHVQDHICTIETYEFEIETVSVSPPLSSFSLSSLPLSSFLLPSFPLLEEKKKKVYREFVGVKLGDYARKIHW